MSEGKEFLGDGVHVDFDGSMLVLMTEADRRNTIYLEPQVYKALVSYVEELRTRIPGWGE